MVNKVERNLIMAKRINKFEENLIMAYAEKLSHKIFALDEQDNWEIAQSLAYAAWGRGEIPQDFSEQFRETLEEERRERWLFER